MWHERHQPLEAAGKVRTIGLIQEQHPDRCALFMQWKQMDFPILVDSLNLLDVTAVPIMVLIDEAGIVKAIRPDEQTLADFVESPKAEALVSVTHATAEQGLDAANRLIMFGEAGDFDPAIAMYEQHCREHPEDGRAHFRLGVAYRKRFDAAQPQLPGDFARSIEHWQRALSLNPNQYIWRRRIQQYGPRLDKPYPFYDWIDVARREIAERGEVPAPLTVELSGAEVAMPLRGGNADAGAAEAGLFEPDPDGLIERDDASLFAIEPVVVRDTGKDKQIVRMHLLLTPSAEAMAKWNDEAGSSVVWIDPPQGWSVDRQLFTLLPREGAAETAMRSLEFEVKPQPAADGSESGEPDHAPIRGYALYNVCFGHEGICVYLRQDFEIPLASRP